MWSVGPGWQQWSTSECRGAGVNTGTPESQLKADLSLLYIQYILRGTEPHTRLHSSPHWETRTVTCERARMSFPPPPPSPPPPSAPPASSSSNHLNNLAPKSKTKKKHFVQQKVKVFRAGDPVVSVLMWGVNHTVRGAFTRERKMNIFIKYSCCVLQK